MITIPQRHGQTDG